MFKKLTAWLVMPGILACTLAACGGGGGGGSSATPPRITTQPMDQTVSVSQTATFSVQAAGSSPLSYQWKKNGVAISGANSDTYTTEATAVSDNNGSYSVTVSNSAGTVTSDSASLIVTLGDLIVSEVSSCFYYAIGCWFEVYNPTGSNIDLAGYQLKATSLNASSGGAIAVTTFSLPSFSIPAGGYAVIAGNTANLPQRGTQVLLVNSGSQVPAWNGSGFIELLKSNATVDFVRFGTSTQTPTTEHSWSGNSVAALAFSATGYGQSIVRAHPGIATTDSNTASDWTTTEWATPGGRNDVAAGIPDADNDGIPDSAEMQGGTYAGLDLYSMGARTGQRDIFIEVDHMDSTDPGVIPRKESLQKVVEAFAAQGISVHFDAGTQFNGSFSTADFNLGQGSNTVPYEKCVALETSTCTANTSDRRSIWDWKNDSSDVRRRGVFHYLLFGNSQQANGSSGSSGRAELPGNDLIVTMGGWGFGTSVGTELNVLINMQASTIMHELGHNLGLFHGGYENTNYKPNYWSVMNYLYQLNGLDANPAGSSAYLRWRKEAASDVALCALPNSPCDATSQFIMSYSNGSSQSLNENSILESNNIGRGSANQAYADWNTNSLLDTNAYTGDLNGDNSLTQLRDHNDWGNLLLPFSRYDNGNSGTDSKFSTTTRVFNPVTNDRQPVAEETAPAPRVFEEIRRAR